MSSQVQTILLADDEQDILMLVNFHLQRAGYQVILAENGREALEKAAETPPALAILDRMMPEIDGVEVCRRLRQINPGIFIIMLTALAADDQRIGGLEAGADDYMVKPFNAKELVLKVKAMMRHLNVSQQAIEEANRTPAPEVSNDSVIRQNDSIIINIESRQAWKDGIEIELTKLEFDLLKFLFENPAIVFSRSRLLEQVWNYDYFGDERVVDVHMARLRKKLENDPSHPRYIQTIRGVGYKYTP